MRSWLAVDDLAHFVLEAVKTVPLSSSQINRRAGELLPGVVDAPEEIGSPSVVLAELGR